MKSLLVMLLALLVCGCATSDFTTYEGAQQKWPTSTGTFVRTINSYNGPGRSGTGKQYTLPVYFGLPNRPYIVLTSRVKTNWAPSVRILRHLLEEIERNGKTDTAIPRKTDDGSRANVAGILSEHGFSAEQAKLIPEGFVSPAPLRRLLILRKAIDDVTEGHNSSFRNFFYIAVANVIANGAGNFAFGPEIYRTKAKADYDVLDKFVRRATTMVDELEHLQLGGFRGVESTVVRDDARKLSHIPEGIGAVITSPPYPNEKDYTRTTRVESLLLGILADKKHLRTVKEKLLRSNTRNVFIKDDDKDEVKDFTAIQQVCEAIESRRKELDKTSGFERLYHKVVAHYFGGMRRHFRRLREKLVPGAQLAYVVGDQLSFLMVPVPTANLLAQVAEAEGLQVIGCDLWRERTGTKIRNDTEGRRIVKVREEVLLLRRSLE